MPPVAVSLRKLFEKVSERKSFVEIADDVKITGARPGQIVSNTLTKGETIPYELADYVLRETIFAGTALERVDAELTAEGLTPTQIAIIKETITQFKAAAAAAPPLAQITFTRDVPGLAISAASPQPAIRPVQERRAVINRRDELKEFTIAKHEHRRFPIPKWLDLAAGAGTELEKS